MTDVRDETARLLAQQALDSLNKHTLECANSYRELRQSVRTLMLWLLSSMGAVVLLLAAQLLKSLL